MKDNNTWPLEAIGELAKEGREKFKGALKDSNWISVEDRLPSSMRMRCHDVLLFNEENKEIVIGFESASEGWVTQDNEKYDGVTHWQPLPSHPEVNP